MPLVIIIVNPDTTELVTDDIKTAKNNWKVLAETKYLFFFIMIYLYCITLWSIKYSYQISKQLKLLNFYNSGCNPSQKINYI